MERPFRVVLFLYKYYLENWYILIVAEARQARRKWILLKKMESLQYILQLSAKFRRLESNNKWGL